jgi:hypothetical protein
VRPAWAARCSVGGPWRCSVGGVAVSGSPPRVARGSPALRRGACSPLRVARRSPALGRGARSPPRVARRSPALRRGGACGRVRPPARQHSGSSDGLPIASFLTFAPSAGASVRKLGLWPSESGLAPRDAASVRKLGIASQLPRPIWQARPAPASLASRHQHAPSRERHQHESAVVAAAVVARQCRGLGSAGAAVPARPVPRSRLGRCRGPGSAGAAVPARYAPRPPLPPPRIATMHRFPVANNRTLALLLGGSPVPSAAPATLKGPA